MYFDLILKRKETKEVKKLINCVWFETKDEKLFVKAGGHEYMFFLDNWDFEFER